MNATEAPATGIPADVLADLESAARYAAAGVRDPEVMRQACERMDKLRETIRRRHGLLDISVPAILELRDS